MVSGYHISLSHFFKLHFDFHIVNVVHYTCNITNDFSYFRQNTICEHMTDVHL